MSGLSGLLISEGLQAAAPRRTRAAVKSLYIFFIAGKESKNKPLNMNEERQSLTELHQVQQDSDIASSAERFRRF